MKQILSLLRKAIEDYQMLEENDHIAVGLSGGKDSLVLLSALVQYQKFSQYKFKLSAIHVDLGFPNQAADHLNSLNLFCSKLSVPLHIVDTQLYSIVFEERKESRPCSLCSKMRTGALNAKAVEIHANKVAYGHHKEDLIETFLLSFIYEGRLAVFKPKSFLDRTNITLIRPLIYISEDLIKKVAKNDAYPILDNLCPMDHQSQREYMKTLNNSICKDIPFAKDRMFSAIINPERNDLFPPKSKV